MDRFVDEAVIEVASGKGGPGCVSFRREKYVPKGGPDGGDGGRGGDIVFIVKKSLKTLVHLRHKQHYRAKSGQGGSGRNKHGKNGENAVIPVPPGSVIKSWENNEILKDFTEEGEEWTFLRGGRGGKGNAHFKSATNQSPRYAQEGENGQSARLRVEINLIADIGFVGLPNAGKSTLLSHLTNARPKIAPYPFTTKIPMLGMLYAGDEQIILADIPGIIEGASEGSGLGLRFLKHINRCLGIAFLIDLSDDSYRETFKLLLNEMRQYSEELARKDRIIIGTKTDLDGTKERFEELKADLSEETLVGVSAFSYEGTETLKVALLELYRKGKEG